MKKRIERLERELGQAEAVVAELHRQMADPDLYADNERVQQVSQAYDQAKSKAAKVTEQWLTSSEELERIEIRLR